MLKTWLANYLLFIHGLFPEGFYDVCVLYCSVSLKDIYFYQQSTLAANNQISKQKMLIFPSVSLLESEKVVLIIQVETLK